MEGASSCGMGVEGATTVGAQLGPLWEEDEGTKFVFHSSRVVSDKVIAPLSSASSITDPTYTSQGSKPARVEW